MTQQKAKETININPICPVDNVEMGKRGSSLSGTRKVQRWGCNRCGRTTIKDRFGRVHDYPLEKND